MENARLFDAMREELEKIATADRSAWKRGVALYADDLLYNLREYADFREKYGEPATDLTELYSFRAELLNGAKDWYQYSYGGSALIYDADIAERLCTPSELKVTRNGERNPSKYETWLDVQARALIQAEHRLRLAYMRAIAKIEA